MSIKSLLPIKYKGVSYTSIPELVKAIGITKCTLYSRYKNNPNITMKELCQVSKGAIPLEYEGIEYKSARDLALVVGIGYTTLKKRLDKGWSIQKACTYKVRKKIPIVVNNLSFNSIKEAARYFNISADTIKMRLNKGWSIEEAFELEPLKTQVECKGIVYLIKNSKDKKKYIGITTIKLKDRFNQHKSSANRGSTTKLHIAMRKIGLSNFKIEKLAYTSSRKELRDLETFYIKKYNSIKQGYNTITGSGRLDCNTGIQTEYKGKMFASYTELANHLGLNKGVVANRLRKGISLDAPLRRLTNPQ